MYKNTFTILLTIFSGTFIYLTSSAADFERVDWTLKRDRDGIQVYTGTIHDSPFEAIKSIVVLESVSLSAMVALL